MPMALGPLRSCGPPASLAAAVIATDALLVFFFCNEDKVVNELLVATPKSCSKWFSVCRTVSDAESQVSGFL